MQEYIHSVQVSVPHDLVDRVVTRVHNAERRRSIERFSGFAITSLLSFGALVAATQYAITESSSSGFAEYASLVFTEHEVAAFWKELALALAESAPILGITFVLGSIGALIWSGAEALVSFRFFKTRTLAI